jgi:RNA ligase
MHLHKYPRTRHLEGSRLQPGDEDLEAVPFAELAGRFVVAEEKLDGANAALNFDTAGMLWLQSRGHFLTGGPREKHFAPFKAWAHSVADALRPVLGSRYVLYGEWLYAKHTIFYDRLPHHFLEFDILDTETGDFLSTDRRRELLAGLPVWSVPVLWSGVPESLKQLTDRIGPSLYKSPDWRDRLREAAVARGLDPERVARETDRSDSAEGLYLKVEEKAGVLARYKYIRADFLTAVRDSGGHWLRRPIVPNQVDPGCRP